MQTQYKHAPHYPSLLPPFSTQNIMSRTGRKRLSTEQSKSSNLCVRLTLAERLQVDELAAQHGCTPTGWMRAAGLRRQISARKVVPQSNRETWLALSEVTQSLQAFRWKLNLDKDAIDELQSIETQLNRILNSLWEGGVDVG